MKKNIFWLICLSLVILAVSLSGCAGAPAEEEPAEGTEGAAMEPVQWSLVSDMGASSFAFQFLTEFCDAVYERTDGLLTIVPYPIGELPLEGTEFIKAVSERTVEIANAGLGYTEGEVQALSIPAWPGLVNTNDDMLIALEAAEPVINEELAEKGVRYIGGYISMRGLGFFGSGDTPASLSEFKGTKVRTYDVAGAEVLSQYGMVPVSIAWAEVVPALQRGVADSAFTGITSVYQESWSDFIDWAYMLDFCGSGCVNIINIEALEELPEDIQAIILEECDNLTAKSIAYNEEQYDLAAAGLQEAGVEVVFATDEEQTEIAQIASDSWVKWAAERGDYAIATLEAIRAALGK